MTGLTLLFVACFLSATVLPFSSELVFAGALLKSDHPAWLLVLIASLGNTLGGLTGYALGRAGKTSWLVRYFGFSEARFLRWQIYIRRYGHWLAFFGFAPIIGDFLGIALGFFRASFWRVAVLMTLGKTLRYILLAWLLYGQRF